MQWRVGDVRVIDENAELVQPGEWNLEHSPPQWPFRHVAVTNGGVSADASDQVIVRLLCM